MKPQKRERLSEESVSRMAEDQVEAMKEYQAYLNEQPWEVVENILRDSGEQV